MTLPEPSFSPFPSPRPHLISNLASSLNSLALLHLPGSIPVQANTTLSQTKRQPLARLPACRLASIHSAQDTLAPASDAFVVTRALALPAPPPQSPSPPLTAGPRKTSCVLPSCRPSHSAFSGPLPHLDYHPPCPLPAQGQFTWSGSTGLSPARNLP